MIVMEEGKKIKDEVQRVVTMKTRAYNALT